MAQTVVFVGAALAVGIWLLGVRSFALLHSEPGRLRRRLRVRSGGPAAMAEVVRWGTAEGRRVIERGERSVRVSAPPLEVLLSLVDGVSGPVLDIRADLAPMRRRYLLAVGILVFGAAPLVIVGLTALLLLYAVPSPNAAARAQAFQILQCVHVLWPPLLLAWQYRQVRGRLLDPLADNLQALLDLAGAE